MTEQVNYLSVTSEFLETVYGAASWFIGAHYPRESYLLPVVWESAREHLDHLTKATEQRTYRLAPAFADQDLVSPTVLGVFAILFTELSLEHNQGADPTKVRKHVEQAARRCGAGRVLTRHLVAAAKRLYSMPLAHQPKPQPREVYEVRLREPDQRLRTSPSTWEDLQAFRARRDSFHIFVDLAVNASVRYGRDVTGLQRRQKQLLAFVISQYGTPCSVSEIFDVLWSEDVRRRRRRASELSPDEAVARVERQRRALFAAFSREGLPRPFKTRDAGHSYLYDGNESFCVIPERPRLAHAHSVHAPEGS